MGHMRSFIAVALLASAPLASAQAAIITNAIAIPDSEVILNFNGTGLDWVYAGPVAPNEFGAGQIEAATYRAAEGWRTATAAEWALRPEWDDFTRPGFATPAPNASFNNHAVYRFTAEYWSNFTHVDLNDFAAGRVTDGVNGLVRGVPETIYVRTSAFAAVPEPGTWAMMLIGFMAVGGALRTAKRRTTAKIAFA